MDGIALEHFLVVGLALFGLGLFTVLTRRNAIGILMGIELILNAANSTTSPSRATAVPAPTARFSRSS